MQWNSWSDKLKVILSYQNFSKRYLKRPSSPISLSITLSTSRKGCISVLNGKITLKKKVQHMMTMIKELRLQDSEHW